MDQVTYQRWWALHLRVARGESLNADERAFYETNQREQDQEERLGDPTRGLPEIYQAIRSLEAERFTLEARRQQLDAEIAALEAALDKRTRQPDGVKG